MSMRRSRPITRSPKRVMFFDGSNVVPTSYTIDGFAVVGTSDILMSFTTPGSLPGVGSFDDSDILRFTASSLGTTTAGTWQMYFNGSDAGLEGDLLAFQTVGDPGAVHALVVRSHDVQRDGCITE